MGLTFGCGTAAWTTPVGIPTALSNMLNMTMNEKTRALSNWVIIASTEYGTKRLNMSD